MYSFLTPHPTTPSHALLFLRYPPPPLSRPLAPTHPPCSSRNSHSKPRSKRNQETQSRNSDDGRLRSVLSGGGWAVWVCEARVEGRMAWKDIEYDLRRDTIDVSTSRTRGKVGPGRMVHVVRCTRMDNFLIRMYRSLTEVRATRLVENGSGRDISWSPTTGARGSFLLTECNASERTDDGCFIIHAQGRKFAFETCAESASLL